MRAAARRAGTRLRPSLYHHQRELGGPVLRSAEAKFPGNVNLLSAASFGSGDQIPGTLAMPILSAPPSLPGTGAGVQPPADLLPFLGRTLELMPTAALVDPDADALAVACVDGTATLLVAARQIDATAPQAGSVVAKKWVAWKCDANACAESTANRKYLELAPILDAAGWYQAPITAPAKLASPGNWVRWTNITGLVAGVSKFGDELGLRFTRAEIAASSLRDALAWVWDGTAFKP